MILPQNHVARLISDFVDSIPQNVLLEDSCSGYWPPPSSHPAIMLKILLFAYSRQTYSGRKIEMMLDENLPMRWLAHDYISFSSHHVPSIIFRRSQHASKLIKHAFSSPFTMAS